MNSTAYRLACCMMMTLLAVPIAVAAPRFRVRDITVAGSVDVDARALNVHGAIVGVYAANGNSRGFILDRGTVVTLPPLCQAQGCGAVPTAIDAAGIVAGMYFAGSYVGWVWQNGGYVAADSFNLGDYDPSQTGPVLNDRGGVAYNELMHSFSTPYAGPLSAPRPIMGLNDLSFVRSLNNRGIAAGDSSTVVFVGRSGRFDTLLPPGASTAAGGFVNNAGQVAGDFSDNAGHTHGFLWTAGNYASFDAPDQGTALSARAIDSRGRVAGVYTDAKSGLQRVFLYNGSTVSAFGNFAAGDVLRVAMNNLDEIVVSDVSETGARSYRVHCEGTGC